VVKETKEMAGAPKTSQGLRDLLFECIEKVRDGGMSPEDAQSVATLAKQICSSVQLEIQVARLRVEYPADTKLMIPAALQLGSPDGSEEKTK
jgi:hypothetical protein